MNAKLRTAVVLTIRLKNVSSRRGHFLETGTYADYDLLVTDEAGGSVPRTDYGRHLAEDERWGSAILQEIQPDGEVEKSIEVTKVYDLSKPGKYYARVTRVVSAEARIDGCEKAVSNPVAFTITE